jgi:hypothetical protein
VSLSILVLVSVTGDPVGIVDRALAVRGVMHVTPHRGAMW